MSFLGLSGETLSAISSVALTATSTIVATVALIVSFRQNVGWAPVALISESNLHGVGGEREYRISVSIEFWNRRKYPVAFRSLVLRVDEPKIANMDIEGRGSHIRDNTIYRAIEKIVDPSGRLDFTVDMTFKDTSLDAMKPTFFIDLLYFDPYRNRTKRTRLKHKFFYPELGWKKSEAERQAAREASDACGRAERPD